MAKNRYLVHWQAFTGTSYAETVKAENELVAAGLVVQKNEKYPEYKGNEIKILSVEKVS
ncbi:hypothetical protein P7D93_19770 [Enterococcus raffinosus]|uniref:hypothetical protein n=1 Tax=Enterococcus raffinosus TaxID=71452 RepID=UPI0028904EBA|nr:hypothetical protein [Enterococcus raffinosus]MDT2532097.1 hypothetical protein [Enterococcus raffinosus]